MNRNITLFRDDFRHFGIGEFPYDKNHSAMGEYNYIVMKVIMAVGWIWYVTTPTMVPERPGL